MCEMEIWCLNFGKNGKAQMNLLNWKILKTLIFLIAKYGAETWSISKQAEKRINAFENKCYRRILRVPWTDKRTNVSIREQLHIKEETELFKCYQETQDEILWTCKAAWLPRERYLRGNNWGKEGERPTKKKVVSRYYGMPSHNCYWGRTPGAG